MQCTDASPVQPVLKESSPGRWCHYTGGMHRCPIGWTGAEDTSSGHLTSSLVQRTANAPMPFSWTVGSTGAYRLTWLRFLPAPNIVASVLPVLLNRRALGLATPSFSFSLSSLEPKSLRMIILTIILVQVLCCHLITKITRNGINGAIFVTNTASCLSIL